MIARTLYRGTLRENVWMHWRYLSSQTDSGWGRCDLSTAPAHSHSEEGGGAGSVCAGHLPVLLLCAERALSRCACPSYS